MGNLNCSNCKMNDDNFQELKNESYQLNPESDKYNKSPQDTISSNKTKDSANLYSDYSMALFQRYNLIRTEPLKFYSESDKYNLTNIIEDLINKSDKDDYSLKLTWSTKKEKIINSIMRDGRIKDIRKKLNIIKKYFSKEFDIKIFYAKGNFERIDDALWNVLSGLKNINENKLKRFLTEKIDYCVIYSINEDDMKFEGENDIKDNEKYPKDGKSNKNGDIISFFILFTYILNLA